MKSTEMGILIGLHRNVNSFDGKTSEIARKCGLTFSQFMVLEALYSKGDMTVGEVRDAILSTAGTISVIINNLVKAGYIERCFDEKDKRKSILHLTEAGFEVIDKAARENFEMIVSTMTVLENDEQRELLRLLKKLGGRQ